ncbi:MmgE/PrpD family protein [Nocardia sp. NPDC052566]|uniref:MmgE/PrpD family protein n=1 Tax=Nocardia sp. NPDC052566 TaxID=3364330 RepID=UPI0037C7A0B2
MTAVGAEPDVQHPTATLAAWASSLRYQDIPEATVGFASSQVISTLAAIRASLAHPLGRRLTTAFGAPLQADPKQSAYVLAGLANCLDFDDVSYVGHLSVSSVTAAIAYSAELRLTGADLLTAVIAGNECAGRLTAATILGPFFRGQTATHCHLMGAAAAVLRARGAEAGEWISALGLALGMQPTPLHRAVLGGELKMLTAGAPVRMALDACDAARAGLAGAPEILGGAGGLLAQLSTIELPDAVVAGLGRRWHSETLTFKTFPGSAYSMAAWECAQRLHRRLGRVDPAAVRKVTVHGSLLTWMLDHKVREYLCGADTSVTAATFSVGYGVATLLRTGTLGPDDFTPGALAEDARWELAAKVEVEHDLALSERMVRATSPLGQTIRQAGRRAAAWPDLAAWAGDDIVARIAELGPPEETFEAATMAIGARMTVELTDGSVLAEDCEQPIGMSGPATRRDHPEIVGRKFLATGGSPAVLAELRRLADQDGERTVELLCDALNDPR